MTVNYRLQKKMESAEGDGVISSADTIGGISDGYHTFDDLYEHRIVLYIALAKLLAMLITEKEYEDLIWRSMNHSDGSKIEGWFLLGINQEEGTQITYHLPMKYWEDCDFAETLVVAPKFDGHTSQDVLTRLKQL